MKIVVIMSDNRPVETKIENIKYNSLAASINYNYCKVNGYDFIYYQPYYKEVNSSNPYNCINFHTGNMRSPTWSKLLSVYLAMDMGYDYVVYIDSDAIFRTIEYKIEHFIEKYNNEFVFLDNSPNLRSGPDNSPCAGFFIVKVSDITKQNIKVWYNHNSEYFDTNTFHEQSVLDFYIKDKMNITVAPEMHFEEEPGQFIRHMHSGLSGYRLGYFTEHMKQHNIDISINLNINVILFDTSKLSNLFV